MMMELTSRVESLETIVENFAANTNAALTRLEREMREFKDETQGFMKRTEQYILESQAVRTDMNKRWGDLANKMGTVVEDIVAPNIPYVAKLFFGVEELDSFAVRVRRRHPEHREREKEFDVVASGGGFFFLDDTKSTPRQEYLERFVAGYRDAVEYFPEYRDLTIVPIFSSLQIPPESVSFLTRHGIYAMTSVGGNMEIVNFDSLRSPIHRRSDLDT